MPGRSPASWAAVRRANSDVIARTHASAAVKQAASECKCYADAMRDIKLPKYETLASYATYLPMNIERYCDYYNRVI